jgi:alpha-galactosidase
MPHAVLGFTTSQLPDTSMALHDYIAKGLRRGRTLPAYVTYNTWYSFGTFLDQPSLMAEMDTAAAMGVEQFVIDAGWWFHINPDDSGDFSRNWGNWQVDPERFPDGLGALRDHAHEKGMRFGIWVEPERVDRDTVGQRGLAKERFLAQSDGRYNPGVPNSAATSAQVCLVDTEARAWVLQKLVEFIDEVRPDYLKWDNNLWVNCNRAGHGHGTADGGFRHHQALEALLEELRGRYPDLDIENCASGGNRMSLGMLRYSDTAWVDDRTDPSFHVRHNVEGLSALLPAAYLLTFTLSTEAEPVTDDPVYDLPKLLRSRMTGTLGFSWMAELGDGLQAALQNQVSLYKLLRPTLQNGSAVLLGRQVASIGWEWSGWDVLEHITPGGDAVIMAFESNDSTDIVVVKPIGLRADAMYGVESADFGPLGEVRGSDLMAQGIELQPSSLSRSHVVFLRPR